MKRRRFYKDAQVKCEQVVAISLAARNENPLASLNPPEATGQLLTRLGRLESYQEAYPWIFA
jgi:hypothetical protein